MINKILTLLIWPFKFYAVSPFKTWIAGEVLTASDLNSSFSQVFDNGESLGWPATASKDLDGQELILDGDGDTSITSDSDDVVDVRIAGTDGFFWGHGTGNTGAFIHIDPGALTATAATNFGLLRAGNTNAVTIPAGTTAIVAGAYFEIPNWTATGTITASATVYIEGAATEGATDYALWVDAGATQLDGTLDVGGTTTVVALTATGLVTAVDITATTARTTTDMVTLTGDTLTTGNLIKATNTISGSSLANRSAGNNLVDIDLSRTDSRTSGTTADDFDLMSLSRTQITTGAGGTLTAAGSVLKLENIATQTAGTLTDTVDVLELVQDPDSAGGALKITGNIVQVEQAASNADIAGRGQWWVENLTPNRPKFTNDAGTDFNLGVILGTEQATTSGTTKDFTGIPAGTKIIIVMFIGVSTNGTSDVIIQLGDAGGFETSGYTGEISNHAGTESMSGEGFDVVKTMIAANALHGMVILALEDSTGFTWAASCQLALAGDTAMFGAGTKSLSAELTQIRLTTENGTDAFDAGAINILYFG